ncbi:hypothetical protein EJ08DRAFT_664092 [Tothia fuscella]|uniref:Uncharacterized protein n=1 Tax=Tothia fuscella TaxID=1048955 RepID=A0A9P4TU31_9PEZI|nr:hypothetical protein EJ08DRAFT_664092 [Tothia fuscella]
MAAMSSNGDEKDSGVSASKSERADTSVFPFLKLPAELREDIYIIFFRNFTIRYAESGLEERLLRKAIKQQAISGNPIGIRPGILCKNTLALLRVNQQIYREASKIIRTEYIAVIGVYDYLPRNGESRSITEPLGLECDEETHEKIGTCGSNELDCELVYTCLTQLDMSEIAKLRNLHLLVQLGPAFPSTQSYSTLMALMTRIAKHLTAENATNPYPQNLCLQFKRRADVDEIEMPMYAMVAKFAKVEMMAESLGWCFVDVPNFRLELKNDAYDIGFVEITTSNNEPGSGQTERAFKYADGYRRKSGVTFLTTVDDIEVDMSDESEWSDGEAEDDGLEDKEETREMDDIEVDMSEESEGVGGEGDDEGHEDKEETSYSDE